MKKFTFPILFVISMLFGACGEERSPIVNEDQVVDTTGNAAPNISSFKSDPSFIVTNEIVSQYGPSSIIRDVVIDNNGTIWMAAWDGIVSYDPETKQFTNHTLKSRLSHHRVYSVMLDSKGNVWFGTLGAGVYKYDGSRFTNWSTHKGLLNDVVMDIAEDAKGNIWFATNKGASRFNGNAFMNLDSLNGIKGAVYALAEDQNGVMWIGGEDGLFQYRQEAENRVVRVREVVSKYSTSYTNVRDLYSDGESMWMSASGGLFHYRKADDDLNPVEHVNKNFTGYIHSDRQKNLLLTTDRIIRFDGQQETVLTITTNNLGLFGATESADGTIWYGAMDGLHSVKDGKDVSYKKP